MAVLTQADQNKIIDSVIDELNKYESRFWANQKMKKGRKDVLKNKTKGYWDAAWGSELGYLKEEIRNDLVNLLDSYKEQQFTDTTDLIKGINTVIQHFEDNQLKNIRTYQTSESTISRGPFTHDKTTHDRGRLENFTFKRINEKLNDLTSNYNYYDKKKINISYDQNILIQDIYNQKFEIKEAGYNKNTGKWKSKKHEQKYNVLVGMENFLVDNPPNSKADIAANKEFSTILNENKKYRDAFFSSLGRKSKTTKLLDRVLLMKDKHLEPVKKQPESQHQKTHHTTKKSGR